MTNAPNSGNDPGSSRSNRRLLQVLGRTGIVLGIISLVGIVGGGAIAWIFVHQRLAPIVQANLSKTLKRPVHLGRVEGFWINGLRFGKSAVPPIPTDPDTASVQAVDVGFNPLDLLWTRTLKLKITLVNPELFLEQDKEGRWITISLEPKEEQGGIKTEVETVQVQHATAVLLPFPKPGNQKLPLKFAQIDGNSQFSEQGKRIRFQLEGQAATGGNFKVDGDSHLGTIQETKLLVQGQNLVAADISRLLKLPNIELGAGFLDANLAVLLQGTQATSISGVAGLKEVSVQIPQLPKSLARTNGNLIFQGTQIELDNVTSIYGQVPAVAAGVFDTKAGFNIKVATAPISLKAILDTFDVKQLPVPVVGEVKADLLLAGTADKPVVSGTVVNTKLSRVDKLNIKSLNANFGLVGSTLTVKSFEAQPSVGGQVAGSGEVKLGANGAVALNFQAQNLPGDAIARIYGVNNLPIRVGRVGGQGRVEGPLGNIETIVRWNAPNATYPATGEVAIVPNGTVSLRDTNIQVAGGTVTGTGQLYPKEGTLQATFRASGVQGRDLEPLLKRQLPPQLQGPISGTFNIAGNTNALQPENLRVAGSASVNVAGGTVQANNINWNAGRFTAAVNLTGVQLGQLAPQGNLKLQGPVSGTLNVAGNLVNNNNEQSAIQAKAAGQLNLGGGSVTVSNLSLNANRFVASVRASSVNLGNLSPQVPSALRGQLSGNFDLAGNLDNLQLATIQGRGSGSLNVDGGTVSASNINLDAGRFSASVRTNSFQVAGIAPQLPPQLRGRLNGNFDVAGSLENLQPSTIQARGSGSLNVGGGTVTASNILANAGRFSASVQASGVQVGSLAPQLPAGVKQGRLNGSFDVAGSLDNPQATLQGRGSGSLSNVGGGTVTASNINLNAGNFSALVETSGVQVGSVAPQVPPGVRRSQLSGSFDVAGNLNNLQPAGIEVRGGSGRLTNVGGGTVVAANINAVAGRFSASVQANGVQVGSIAPQVPPGLRRSQLTGNFDVAGNLNNLQPAGIEVSGGSASLTNVGGGTVTASNINAAAGRFSAIVQANDVQVGSIAPQVPPGVQQGRLTGNFDVAGNLNNLQPAGIQVRGGSGSLTNVGGGTVTASNINAVAGRFSATVQASGIQVGSIAPQAPSAVQQSTLNGTFDVAGNLNNLQPSAIQAKGSGSLNNVAGGTINASNINLDAGRFSAAIAASGVGLSPFSSQLRGNVSGNLNVAGSLAALSPSNLKASGNLNFSQGVSSIDKPLTTAFNWDGQNLQIQRASAPGLEASGVVSFARVSEPIVPPISSFNLNVNAQDLNLQELPVALPNNTQVAGLLDFNGNLSGTLSAPTVIGNNLRLRNLVVGGYAFDPVLTGNVRLVAGRGGEIQLQGNVQDRIALTIAPNNQPTSFAVNLGLRNVARSNQTTTERIVASGRTQGNQLLVDVGSLPLGPVKRLIPSNLLAQLPPVVAKRRVGGTLSGNFAFTFDKGGFTTLPARIVANNLAIANPVYGNVDGKGNQITVGSLSYANGNIQLSNALFQSGASKYALSGSLNANANGPGQLQALVTVAQGKIQDLVKVASIFGITDVQDLATGFNEAPANGSATDVKVQAIGDSKDSLLAQLRRLAEIEAYRQSVNEARANSPLPELSRLEGTFDGEARIAGSLKQGFVPDPDSLNVSFNLNGTDWNWGDRYAANRVIAKGGLQNGVITLLPLRFESGNTLVAFSGNVGGEQQNGQLQVRNLPVDELQQIFNLPVNVAGSLNASATLAGSIKNPLARGEATLSNGLLNGASVQSARASFNYGDARLNFSSNGVVAALPETANGKQPNQPSTPNPPSPPVQPINIIGSIPYKLPFASVNPDNNQFTLTLDAQDRGLALLNVLTRGQIAWVNGSGRVNLGVRGSLDPKNSRIQDLVAQGTATANNATIKSQLLPDPLTNVNSTIAFNLNQVQVNSFQAKYGNGSIAASGTLPISTPADGTRDSRLDVNIGELGINLKGLYNGGVKGDVQITGAALAPKISGTVQLFNGSVQVQAERPVPTAAEGTGSNGGGSAVNPIEFNNLKLILGKGIQVTQTPIFNFLADGELTVNGTLDNTNNIRPSGTISLKRGQVNLFTTQFRLDRGYTQTATFVPDQGLVPNLDVRLVANVVESSGSRLPTSTALGEANSSFGVTDQGAPLRNLFAASGEIREDIPAINAGGVGTVRIQARVLGPANQLSQSLVLTSTPSRSESELVALLGGGFVQTLGRGDTTLGLANFAGSALLGNVQNIIGDALGLSEFRIFPTVSTNKNKTSSSTLDLAAEVGVDLNRRLSATALKVLTSDQPPQFGLRYRVDDKILLRGSTDLSGDNRALVEYEKRF